MCAKGNVRRISMPENGWYSLTVRKETAMRARELIRDRSLTVDDLLKVLKELFSKVGLVDLYGVWGEDQGWKHGEAHG